MDKLHLTPTIYIVSQIHPRIGRNVLYVCLNRLKAGALIAAHKRQQAQIKSYELEAATWHDAQECFISQIIQFSH